MLMLMRHAKSSWDVPEPDIDRALNARGRRDAPAMARHLAGLGLAPARVLCSPARRTRETLALMAPLWPLPEPTFIDALYDAGHDDIAAVLDAEGADGTLLIGHNPGLHELALDLVRAPEDRARLAAFPTSAFAAIEMATGRLVHLVTPKALVPGQT